MVALPAVAQSRISYPQTQGQTPARGQHWQEQEWLKCSCSALYFTYHFVEIYDALVGDWIAFKLWPAQAQALKTIQDNRQVVILKARQLGVTWLALSFALWLMLFHPAATILLFSRRDDEAIELLDKRLKGMYKRLPEWMQARAITVSSKHEFALSNGSRALSFPSNGGDSYTATLVVADEFDLVQDQGRLLGGMKPTIDNGGRLILLSRPDKSRPQTPFKSIYRAAKSGENDYRAVFLAWSAHPRRDCHWYDRQKSDAMSQAGATNENEPGALDDLHEQYPATDSEALAARSGDKRLAASWLEQCYVDRAALDLPADAPSIEALRLYHIPVAEHHYVIGIDAAEGNPTSDDSALTVRCRETGGEVASLAGKFQPATLAAHADSIGQYFNDADLMPERNNHGHYVIGWLDDNSELRILDGHDKKPGWLSSSKGKTLLYDAAADHYRHGEGLLHSFKTLTQLQSIEGSTLRAPEGLHDDLADSDALSIVALLTPLENPNRFLPTMALWITCQESPAAGPSPERLVVAISADRDGACCLLAATRHPDPDRHAADLVVRHTQICSDEETLTTAVQDLCRDRRVVTLLGDEQRFANLLRQLKRERVAWVQDFPASKRPAADTDLRALIMRGGIAHAGDPALTAHLSNANRKLDESGQRMRLVARGERPVGLAVCLSMAARECLRLNL